MLNLWLKYRIYQMSKIEDVVDSIENKMSKVLHKMQVFKQTNKSLSLELEKTQQHILQLEAQIVVQKEQFKTLKMANAMLGSDGDKRETKLKINALIKDIDYCISQLSE
jgi:hypothetical protein